jgi:hypothetical protein
MGIIKAKQSGLWVSGSPHSVVWFMPEFVGGWIPSIRLEINTIWSWLKHVGDPQGYIKVTNIFLVQAHEVGEKYPGDTPMADNEHIVGHSFDLEDYFAKSVDDV